MRPPRVALVRAMSRARSDVSQVEPARTFGWGGAAEALSSQHLDKIGAWPARKRGGICGAGNGQRLLDEWLRVPRAL